MLRAIAEFESASAVLIGWPLALPPSLLQRFAEHVNIVVVLDERSCRLRAQLSATVPNHRLVLVPQPALLNFSRFGRRRGSRLAWTQDTRPWWVADGAGQLALAADIVYEANCPARECPSHRGSPWNRVVADAMPFHLSRQLRQPYGFVSLVGSGGNFMTDGNGTAVFTTRLLRDNRKCLGSPARR